MKTTSTLETSIKSQTPTLSKAAYINALRAFIAQRSGIQYTDYASGSGDESRASFMGDYRPILRAGREAKELLRFVANADSITKEDIIEGSKRAYSGRLEFVVKGDKVAVDYCTGQYFPTEYRNAACAVLASTLWRYAGETRSTGEEIRKWAKQQFGRGIASRWFN